MASSEKEHPALGLLTRAHDPSISSQIFREKVQNRPLLLRPSSPDSREDARSKRQKARLEKAKANRKSKKPRPLTAKQKRELGVYDIPKEQQKYDIYVPIWKLWCAYMREILGMEKSRYVNAAGVGPLLASADYHGAMVDVVRCRCVGRVGIRGIVVKDTKFTLEIITPKNELKTVPKEYTVFRFEVPFVEKDNDGDSQMAESQKPFIFELHGSQFQNRAADRAARKFKQHIDPDL
ncbi:RNase P/MRP, p29 subunit [Aureobasidium pullulans]|uniref:Ribonuclease P protein subunit n=1 Tax=Aureobasidium pullulans TaxID=5580 RepID=A0A4S9DW67_AURPU|nr:RNase P/MRP, p29 subunit [Aureobasidium pullulans]THX57761.1 RNase P/MRP, p29 subunit [Aureobasidium pullulans]THX86182.1 RNase P/MRP, p29 subunit [Aureobasidium pullulans]